jgi:hypothetical protein
MDKAEAMRIVQDRLATLRKLTPAELASRYLDNPSTDEVTAASGTTYQIETQALWDDRAETNLRVMVSVDDGGWRAFAPLSDSFIVAPDGTFIGQ